MVDWKTIMLHWSSELMTTDLLDPDERTNSSPDWLGYPPASTSTIADLESRLGLKLPPSYRAFLEVTNGWGRLDSFIGRLRPASEVDWFVRENEQWAEVYADTKSKVDDDYLTYNDAGMELSLCGAHARYVVQVADVGDGVMLLNPLIQSQDGEWEAWFFAHWVPGARRYPSFAHLMLATYRSMRLVNKVGSENFPIPTLPILSPSEFTHLKPAKLKLRGKEQRLSKKTSTLEELIEKLNADPDHPDKKLIRALAGKLKGRPRGKRDAVLTLTLSEIFLRAGDPDARSFCIQAITEFAPDGPPPPVLRQAYEDLDVGVMLSAVYSHHYFPQPDAVSLFSQLIRRDIHPIFKENMIGMLGELGDEAAIPALKALLLDTSNTFDQSFGSVGLALGHIGGASFELLKAAASHSDRRVRLAAAIGLDFCGDTRASEILGRLEADPDQAVATRAKQRLGRGWLKVYYPAS